VRFLIADSGMVAEKTGDAMEQYNRVSLRARRLVTLWNESHARPVTCLREAVTASPTSIRELEQLAAMADRQLDLPSRLRQFLAESNELIPGATNAIAQQDWSALRQFIDDSQRGAETGLRNQVPGTIALQRRLLDAGAIAASAFGAGFGGSVWGLFRETEMAAAAGRLADNYRFFTTRPGCAARDISSSRA
jgi:galactokinase